MALVLNSDPTTHDFTVRCWGHDFSIMEVVDGGLQLRLMGWGGDRPSGQRPEVGDYLILSNGKGTARYRATEVGYYRNPRHVGAHC